jgi:prepilin peptidase CpaA
MPLADLAGQGTALAVCVVLAWAALCDIRTRKIPNAAVLAVLALFLPWSFAHLGSNLASSFEAAALVLAVTVGLYACKIFGAGDSKMFTAIALFTGMGYLPYFALITALAGGLYAVMSLATQPRYVLAMIQLRRPIRSTSGVPYGAALAIGGAGALWVMLGGAAPPYDYGLTPHVTSEMIAHTLAAPSAH